MTKHERSLLKELLYSLEQKEQEMNMINSREQEVMGEQRKCCIICGHCPSTIAERLREVLHE